MACRILFPWPGIKPTSPALEGRFLTTGLPGKPHSSSFFFLTAEYIGKNIYIWYFLIQLYVNGPLGCFLALAIVNVLCYAQSPGHIWLFCDPITAAYQTPLFMEFSRQEYWSRLPFPTPGNLPNLGIEPESPASPVLAGRFFYHWAVVNSVYQSFKWESQKFMLS